MAPLCSPLNKKFTLFYSTRVLDRLCHARYCYTMMWIKASVIDGGSRVMPVVYFVGMSIGILVLIILNEYEKSSTE